MLSESENTILMRLFCHKRLENRGRLNGLSGDSGLPDYLTRTEDGWNSSEFSKGKN